MKILLVSPYSPESFLSFAYILKFISKKSMYPPLGLLTVAAMLPEGWDKRLIDMNVTDLTDEDILWADYVFVTGMQVQRDSAKDVIRRCNQLNRKIVAGGPLFSTSYDEFEGVDHLVLGEAEVTLAPFLLDLAKGSPKPIYESAERPAIIGTPLPMWSLIDPKDYGTMSVQYSRGCPFDCEFCDVVRLYGHEPRTKSASQMLDELDALHRSGWEGEVFVVDDNFIGNKKKLKAEVLPAIIGWSKKNKYPFYFATQASINLADDAELMQLMVEAGFSNVFVGIESPNIESLAECNKQQNTSRDLVAYVRKIQNSGLKVSGGFIIGFDNDPISIFESQIDFIQKSGIVVALVSLLNAPRGTRLYQRLKAENRLLKETSGDSADGTINFLPRMDYETLITGYKHVLNTIYSPRQYCERVLNFFAEYKPQEQRYNRVPFNYITSMVKSLWLVGVVEPGRGYFWKLFVLTMVKYPQFFWQSISFSIYRLHFYKHTRILSRSI